MSEYIIDESGPFVVQCNGKKYTAIVRYYTNGDYDIELNDDDAPSEVYDLAWEKAEQLELIAEHGNGFDVPSDYGY